jgi:hypothetical protein
MQSDLSLYRSTMLTQPLMILMGPLLYFIAVVVCCIV